LKVLAWFVKSDNSLLMWSPFSLWLFSSESNHTSVHYSIVLMTIGSQHLVWTISLKVKTSCCVWHPPSKDSPCRLFTITHTQRIPFDHHIGKTIS
jgi:hypothetical protein